jgi:hypothetical protein
MCWFFYRTLRYLKLDLAPHYHIPRSSGAGRAPPRGSFWEIRSDRGPGTWALARPVSTVQASAWPRAAVGRLA